MAATPTAIPWHPAAIKDARQAASFGASRANTIYNMDVQQKPPEMAYLRLSKKGGGGTHQQQKLWVHPFVPYGGNNLSYKKKTFNYRLPRARRYI
jgi:hypothetical protein